jgi:hypothetical protein
MDYMGDDDGVRATLRENAGLFEDSGFVVSDRSRDRIVRANWGVESADELESDELLNDVASEFIKLVELGHRVFTGEDEEN